MTLSMSCAGTNCVALAWTPVNSHVLPHVETLTLWSLKRVISPNVCNQSTPNTIWHPQLEGRENLSQCPPLGIWFVLLCKYPLYSLSPPSTVTLKACSSVTRRPVLCSTLGSMKLWVEPMSNSMLTVFVNTWPSSLMVLSEELHYMAWRESSCSFSFFPHLGSNKISSSSSAFSSGSSHSISTRLLHSHLCQLHMANHT